MELSSRSDQLRYGSASTPRSSFTLVENRIANIRPESQIQCMKFKAIIHEAEEGGFWAEVPALPGCSTQGESLEELTENLKDAIALWLDVGEDEIESQNPNQILEVAV